MSEDQLYQNFVEIWLFVGMATMFFAFGLTLWVRELQFYHKK